ncbi:hypothetical protein DYB34_009466 [Aphanomyces astaci]|uniref:EF-hand domain-containing protein n=2 Tax=Aphanomyces astaci TaxID=112090 RepID=A0A418BH25_APHAT|nr:hypothetical protein DYB34_009466 [Aphanomyces astaci]
MSKCHVWLITLQNKDTGKTNMGRFWISVYGQRPVFHLEGGQPIVEEEEITDFSLIPREASVVPGVLSPAFKEIVVPGEAQHRQFENLKDEMLAQARAKGRSIGYREAKREFANAGALRKTDFKRRMMNLGFKMDEMSDEKVLILFNGMDKDKSNTIQAEELLECFMLDIEEDRIASVVPEREDEEVPEKVNQEGILEVHVVNLCIAEIKQHTLPLLTLPSLLFSAKEALQHGTCVLDVLEDNPALLQDLHVAFLQALHPTDAVFHKRIQELVTKYKQPKQKANPRGPKKKLIRHDTTPVQQFFALVQTRLDMLAAAEGSNSLASPTTKEKQASESRKPFNWAVIDSTDSTVRYP